MVQEETVERRNGGLELNTESTFGGTYRRTRRLLQKRTIIDRS